MAVRTVGFSRLTRKLDKLDDAAKHHICDQMADAGAFVIEGEAKVRAAVDTGFMRNSIYVVTAKRSTYLIALIQAKMANIQRGTAERPMLPEHGPMRYGYAAVVVGAEYAVHQEFNGTAFLRPAVDDNTGKILKVMSITADRLIGKALK